MNTNEDNYRPLESDLVHTNTGVQGNIPQHSSGLNQGRDETGMNTQPTASDLYLFNRLNRPTVPARETSQIILTELPPLDAKNKYSSNNLPGLNKSDAIPNSVENAAQPNIEEQLMVKLNSDSLVLGEQPTDQQPEQPTEFTTGNNEMMAQNNQKDATPDQPFYVNAKQYYRILKRRYARARLEENLRISRKRRPYLHESRHKHAMRRPRGQGGRFLTAAEIEEMKNKEGSQDKESSTNTSEEKSSPLSKDPNTPSSMEKEVADKETDVNGIKSELSNSTSIERPADSVSEKQPNSTINSVS